jgi:hypothetical protein
MSKHPFAPVATQADLDSFASHPVNRVHCGRCRHVSTLASWAYEYGWLQVAHLGRPNEWLCPACKSEVV